jgi:hypothetical protein
MKLVRWAGFPVLALVVLFAARAAEAQTLQRFAADGSVVKTSKKGDVTRTVIHDKSGRVVFSTQLTAGVTGVSGTFSYSGSGIVRSIELDDVRSFTPERFSLASEYVWRQVRRVTDLQGNPVPYRPGDVQGCDNLHWMDCTSLGSCCDSHDRCYADNDCTAWSWLGMGTMACQACNRDAVLCIGGGGTWSGGSSCCRTNSCGQPWPPGGPCEEREHSCCDNTQCCPDGKEEECEDEDEDD